MKGILLFIALSGLLMPTHGQHQYTDSLLKLLPNSKDDDKKINLLFELGNSLEDLDSAILFAEQGVKLAQLLGDKKGEAQCKGLVAILNWSQGDFPSSIKLGYSALEYFLKIEDTSSATGAYAAITNSYRDQGDYQEALRVLETQKTVAYARPNCEDCGIFNAAIGSNYYGLKNFDSALYYLHKGLSYGESFGRGWILLMIGKTQEALSNDSLALDYYRQSIESLFNAGNTKDLAGAFTSLGNFYLRKGLIDSSVKYGKLALQRAKQYGYKKELAEAYFLLSLANEKISTTEALAYYKLAINTKDSIYSQERERQIAGFKFIEELRRTELKNAEQQTKSRNRFFAVIGLLVLAISVAIVFVRASRQKQKTNKVLQLTLTNLKATQTQLIQAEKMASLGELTAGIAHEIQNPLNFVNNFSDVNTELIDEANQEIEKGNTSEVKAILNDIKDNEQKINHHGKRADAIVKGMLQHSRASSRQKELTDLNKLADEYLRLAYHGLRAKDKSFNAEIKTDFDSGIGKINIVRQDIGRVLLNLINNAFYAVGERQKLEGVGYKPTVAISTASIQPPLGVRSVQIKVVDNGGGIADPIKEKIFQPFFTTKPTGQGTGLGLSLAYDIVKAHGGEIKVETKQGEGSGFVIRLPVV